MTIKTKKPRNPKKEKKIKIYLQLKQDTINWLNELAQKEAQ